MDGCGEQAVCCTSTDQKNCDMVLSLRIQAFVTQAEFNRFFLTAGGQARMMTARCITLATANIGHPTSLIMKNAGQGFVRWMTKADAASHMASAFHTTMVETQRPGFLTIRNATHSAMTPITASPISGISRQPADRLAGPSRLE